MMQKKLRCLVLGGKGFIGSHLVDALINQGHFVRVFDRPHVESISDVIQNVDDCEVFEGDIASETDVIEALEGCDVCFHLISTTLPKSSNHDPIFDIETNLMGTVKLLKGAVSKKLKKVLFLSSGGTVYGVPSKLPIDEMHQTEPLCSYGIIKLSIEKYLNLYYQIYGLDYTVLRLSNPYGERQRTLASQGAVAVFLGKILRGECIDIWGDGTVIRDYIYISDVVSAMIAAMEYQGAEHVFNIGSGQGISLNDVISGIENVTSRKANVKYVAGRDFDVPVSVLDVDRARKELQWSPQVSFISGIERMANYLIENDM